MSTERNKNEGRRTVTKIYKSYDILLCLTNMNLQACNRCRCSPNGRWMCTRKMCISTAPETAKQITPIEPKSDECTPGTRFRKDCNWCFCTNTGVGLCTLKGCGIERPRISYTNDNAIRARRQVKEEKVYTEEEVQSPNFTCTPSYSFKVLCNTCWCSADGKRPRYCTRIACKNSANVYSTLPPPTNKNASEIKAQ